MKNQQKTVKVAIVDDSDFFNSVISRHVEQTLEKLNIHEQIDYTLHSFLNARDFMRNYPEQYDILLLDYYLGDGYTGMDIIEVLEPYKNNIVIAIISQQKNLQTSRITVSKGATTFIKKDRELLESTSLFVEDMVHANFISKNSGNRFFA